MNIFITLGPIFVSVLALVLSTRLTLRANRTATRAQVTPVAVDMLNEYRSDDFKKRLHYVIHGLPTEYDPSATGLYGLPEAVRWDVLSVSHFFDHIGALVAAGLVSRDLIASFMGETVMRAWTALEPYIEYEAEIRGGDYQVFFTVLADLLAHTDPIKLRNGVIKRAGGTWPLSPAEFEFIRNQGRAYLRARKDALPVPKSEVGRPETSADDV